MNQRLKWTVLVAVGIVAINMAVDQATQSVRQTMFVEAGEDWTFEEDDIYDSYFESAKMQKDLLRKQKKNTGHQTWSFDNYQKFQKKRIQTKLLAQEMLMEVTPKNGWPKRVPNLDFDKIPAVEKQANGNYTFRGESYKSYVKQVMEGGYIEEYYQDQRCYSSVIDIPGTSLMPTWIMGFSYFVFMIWLFMGIAISADIFMEAIEVITSKTQLIVIEDPTTGAMNHMEVPVWNPTLANLTLMAFGSSAPEIILAVVEALKDLGAPAGDLGPSTIVGSAAFNLLVISAVSIIAVGGDTDEVKKIDDMGVFVTTAVFSVFAYIWMYYCLAVSTPGQVTVTEAYWTFSFFFILLILAFGADKLNQKKKKKMTEEEEADEQRRKFNKAKLRMMSRVRGEPAILAAAQGQTQGDMKEQEVHEVQDLFKHVLQTDNLLKVDMQSMSSVLEPEALFERFAYRRAHHLGGGKEFLAMKGQKFQMENELTTPVKKENSICGFKCLHYSVTESAGTVKVTLMKKNQAKGITIGVRTVEDSAKEQKDFKSIDEQITMTKEETEKIIEIPIIDDEQWNPDLDFWVEVYDTKTGKRLIGDDTHTKVTILDEDNPGKLAFQQTELLGTRKHLKVDVLINRYDGTDGDVSCQVRTEPLITGKGYKGNSQNAIEHIDYIPINTRVHFAPGESQKTISVKLIDRATIKVHKAELDNLNIQDEDEDDEDLDEEEEEGDVGPKFKVIIEQAKPAGCKVSKKNTCIVEIRKEEIEEKAEEENMKLLHYYSEQKNPSWSLQFKQAVMLSPTVDEDNLIVEQVSFEDAMMHFITMFWKLLFSFIPPTQWGNGWPAFIVALCFIGFTTAIVAEAATVLGCTVGLKEAVTAITLVAIGTSLPDTFASMTAARTSEFADSAIGNVTGSNSVNVFVGLGLPWVLSSVYAQNHGKIYETPPGNLAFSVMLFLCTSMVCFIVLGVRRSTFGGELGGPKGARKASAVFLVFLWLIYITFSSLKAYDVIEGI